MVGSLDPLSYKIGDAWIHQKGGGILDAAIYSHVDGQLHSCATFFVLIEAYTLSPAPAIVRRYSEATVWSLASCVARAQKDSAASDSRPDLNARAIVTLDLKEVAQCVYDEYAAQSLTPPRSLLVVRCAPLGLNLNGGGVLRQGSCLSLDGHADPLASLETFVLPPVGPAW